MSILANILEGGLILYGVIFIGIIAFNVFFKDFDFTQFTLLMEVMGIVIAVIVGVVIVQHLNNMMGKGFYK